MEKKNGPSQIQKKKYLHIKREHDSILVTLNYKLDSRELSFLVCY